MRHIVYPIQFPPRSTRPQFMEHFYGKFLLSSRQLRDGIDFSILETGGKVQGPQVLPEVTTESGQTDSLFSD